MSSRPPDDVISKVRAGPQPEDYRPQSDIPPPIGAFEPVPEASATPSTGDSAAGLPPFAEHGPIVGSEPANRLPQRKVARATTPWLPPTLGATLPRLALPVILISIPIAAAFALQAYLSGAHGVYDDALQLADGGTDEVTALEWSPLEGGPLLVGTRLGSVKHILRDGTVEEVLSPSGIDPADGEATSPVQSFHALSTQSPVVIYQDRLNPATDRPTDAVAVTGLTSGLFSVQGGLFAAVDANNGSAVVGRAVVAGSGQAFEQPANNAFIGNPVKQQEQQQQQQLIQQPFGEQKKGAMPPQQVPIDPGGLPSAPPRYSISLFRDLQNTASTMVGEIFGIDDVRAVAALPGTNTVIAGDGSGNVFAIDAAEQISGVSPETYIRGIGQHEAAIVEIVIAAQPSDRAVLFATRAEDRTIKVWRGSVSRARQLLPLGDYPNADVTTPGSTWVRAPFDGQGGWRRLVSMNDNGNLILGLTAQNALRLIAINENGQARILSDFAETYGEPAVLSPDGSSMIAVNQADSTVDLIRLPSGDRTGVTAALPETVKFPNLPKPTLNLAYGRNGRSFVAVSSDQMISIQNIATPDEAIGLSQTGFDEAMSPDGSLVAVAKSDGTIRFHSTEDGRELMQIQAPYLVDRAVFDETGKRVHVSIPNSVHIYTYSLRSPYSSVFGSEQPADSVQDDFIPNGNRYFSRDGNVGFRMIDIDSGTVVGRLQGATGATGWVSNFDGSRIATLGGRGNISLFREEESATDNGPMPALAGSSMRLSADGSTLIVGGRTGEMYHARLDQVAGQTGPRLRRLDLPAPALQYAIAPDGTSIVTAQADGTVAISDLPSSTADNTQTTASAAPALANTIEISGHGALLTAMALSPDGGLLATASLDGRLRITNVSLAKFVHGLPFSALPSGPERRPLEAEPLDDSPYALMGEPPASGNGGTRPFVVVYNARTSLGEARDARDRAAAAGFPDGLIYRRQGFFRGVFAFEAAEARDAALSGIQEAFAGAYSRDLGTWCPDAVANENDDFFECAAVLAGSPPRAMAN